MELIYPTPKPSITIDGESKQSQIQAYFKNSTVFITGATGFLGSLLVEKLLRTCHEVKKIYILMRPKKGVSIEQRFLEYFQKPIFEEVSTKCPKMKEKVVAIFGDCALENLGISDDDRQIILNEVNCIVHLAATVRFDEKLRIAAHINVRATRDLLKMAAQVTNLSSIIYVSTAFSNCPSKHIDEVFYKPPIAGAELLAMVDLMSEELINDLTPKLIGNWPNTYAFTKIVAEDIVKTEGKNLPIAICRPAIVIATANEPIPGWIDNFYGAAGVFAGAGIGLIRTLYCKRANVAEMVPADYVINNILAAAWSTAQTKSTKCQNRKELQEGAQDKSQSDDIPIYNYVSGSQNPISWGKSMDLGFHYGKYTPSVMEVWHPFLFLVPFKNLQVILHYLLHIIPAYIIDFLAVCFGKTPRMVKAYAKITKFLDAIAYFSSQQWRIENHNTQNLWNKLNDKDQELFKFNIQNINWDAYFKTFFKGIRLYVIKDPLETVPQGLVKYRRIKIAHYFILSVFFFFFVKFLLWACNSGF